MKTLTKGILSLFFFMLSFSLNANQANYHGLESESQFFDSLNVRFVGDWPFARARLVECDTARDLIFLSSGAGIYVLDISNPNNPVKISEKLHSRKFISDELFYDANTKRLYLSVSRWFEIWDLSNPNFPTQLGQFIISDPSYISDIYVSGSYAYCVDNQCFSVVDVTSPSNPLIVGSCEAPGASIAVKDSFAYVVSFINGLRVVDISDQENPEIVASAWTPEGDITIFNSYAYISTNLGMRIIDISDPLNPYTAGYFPSPNQVNRTFVLDTIAYLSTSGGLRIVNVSDPANTSEIGFLNCESFKSYIFNSYAYIADETYGLRIADVSSPSNPQEIGNFITPGISKSIFVSGSFAYVAHGKGLSIVDVSQPTSLKEVGRCYFPSRDSDVFISGSYAHVADKDSGLQIIDVSDPCNPYRISSLELPYSQYPRGIRISGHYCFVTCGFSPLQVIDISDPLTPYMVGACSLNTPCYAVDVSGSYAYVASHYYFSVIDISDPFNPQEISSEFWLGVPAGIFISGMHAFVIDCDYAQLDIIDISNPNSPQLIARVSAPWDGSGVHVSGQYAYISSRIAALHIYNVSQPANPFWVGYYHSIPSSFTFRGLFVMGTYAYVASCYGLQIYQFYGAAVEEELEETIPAQTSLKVLQNPVNGNCIELLLAFPVSDKAEITLYNQIGQRLRHYQFNGLKPGGNKLRLDAKGLAAGIYFLKLNGSPAGKLVKVR